jgi:two-component system, NtrC family, sensor kinase
LGEHWAIQKKSKEGGIITVKTWSDPQTMTAGLSVSDTGIGIPEENLKKLFTPFFTTKDIGEGTGLGLALFYNIIKSHNGEIKVQSQVGSGTAITLIFPSLS